MKAHELLQALIDHFTQGSRAAFLRRTGLSPSYFSLAKRTESARFHHPTLRKIENAFDIIIINENGEYVGWKKRPQGSWVALTDPDAFQDRLEKLYKPENVKDEIEAIVRDANRQIEDLIGQK